MYRILPYIFSFLGFVGTFLFIRLTGRLFRWFFTKERTKEWDQVTITLVRSFPTVLTAVVMVALSDRFGWLLLSASAIWLSLAWDGIHLASLIFYVGQLRKLRKHPGSYFFHIRVGPYDDWPESNLPKIFPLRFWLRGISLPTILRPFAFVFSVFGRSRTSVGILYGDFRRFLGADFRYIDEVDDIDNKLGLKEDELWAVPHLSVKNAEHYKRDIFTILGSLGDIVKDVVTEQAENGDADARRGFEGFADAISTDASEPKYSTQAYFATSKSFVINRTINTALPESLWRASCRLCESTPPIVAVNWKLYHFQEDIRLRLVTLFNTAELLQRLLATLVLTILDRSGELDGLLETPGFLKYKNGGKFSFPPAQTSDWSAILRQCLERSESSKLEFFRVVLLANRPSFDADLEKLKLFRDLLQFDSRDTPKDALGYLAILTETRNKTVGHGAVGWRLQLRPAAYLSALHTFFLAAVEEISDLELGVYAYRDGSEAEEDVISVYRGIEQAGSDTDSCLTGMLNPFGGEMLNVYPYLRIHNGRLLIVDKFPKGKGNARYVDFSPEHLAAPTYVTLPVDWKYQPPVSMN